MIRFVISYFIFSAIIAAPIAISQYMGMGAWVDPGFWKFFIFFFILTSVVCITVIFGQERDPMLGTQLFLGTMVIKLLLCMVFSLIYISKNAPNALHFVFSFFYLYFLNTAFEIFSLISNLRHLNKK